MKKKCFLNLLLASAFLFLLTVFSACQEGQLIEPISDEALALKKGKMPNDVQQGDLYGDLWELERTNAGVPVLYPLQYKADYQDQAVEGIIDVVNPRLDGPFILNIIVRDENGDVVYTNPTDGSDPEPQTATVLIDPGSDGFLNEDGELPPIALYDAEGEILADVSLHVFPVEEGRLNIVRSPSYVQSRRIAEVIKNFGDGTVADVIRDYCGRFFMVRTQDAIDVGIMDKPIDSPLENLSMYYELLINGFNISVEDNGLLFLVTIDNGWGGYNFQSRLDSRWAEGPFPFNGLNDNEKRMFIWNLAASCVAAGSDKSSFLNIDEIVFLNQFMGIPKAIGSDIDKPADEVISFFPWVEQEVRMMDKTDKHQFSKYRYYIDYSTFSYSRDKFMETYLDYVTIVGDYDENGHLIGSHVEVLAENITLDEILMGTAPLTADVLATHRYTQKENQQTSGALGFANQADDYVQALEVVHENEEFLVWKIPSPTWDQTHDLFREFSPFHYVPTEESHSKKPENKGHNSH